MEKTGILYLIPNTLGNTEADQNLLAASIPHEAIAMTARLSYFIAENAKTARAHLKLVSQVQALSQPLQQIRMRELNTKTPLSEIPRLLAPLLAGEDGGLISEAGVPAIADPGAGLIKIAHQSGIPVKPLVGPSSILLALMGSGLNGQNFAFNGYLPTDPARRIKQIKQLEEHSRRNKQTQIFIETPYRNQALFEALCHACKGSTHLCIATDLTLPSESIVTLAINQWEQKLSQKTFPGFQRKPTIFLFLAE